MGVEYPKGGRYSSVIRPSEGGGGDIPRNIAPFWEGANLLVEGDQPRSQGFSLFVIGKAGKGSGTGRSSMYSDWSMTSTLLCK
jgi:hypothetical protein